MPTKQHFRFIAGKGHRYYLQDHKVVIAKRGDRVIKTKDPEVDRSKVLLSKAGELAIWVGILSVIILI